MKTRLFPALLFFAIALLATLAPNNVPSTAAKSQTDSTALAPATPRDQVAAALKNAPVMFIENVGQFDKDARFQVRGGNSTVYLADDALWFTVLERPQANALQRAATPTPERLDASRTVAPRKGVNLKMSFVGANPRPLLEPFNRLDVHVSYFAGNDPAKWRADVPVWGGVRYKDLYPGIDLEVTSEGSQMIQRVVTQPGADLNVVRLRVDGADKITLESDRLRLATTAGEYGMPLLQVATTPSRRLPAPTIANNQIAAPFTSAITSSKPAAASPRSGVADLVYSTFLGGSGDDYGYAIAVDSSGAALITGKTASSNFPSSPGAYDTTYNSGYDVFVAKLNNTGSALVYATFLGGSGNDFGYGIAVDGSGAAYVTGGTSSPDFPTTSGAYDTSQNGGTDAFVAKLNSTGTALTYSTFLGGSSNDSGYSLAVDGSGAAYVAGYTSSSNFPTTPGAYDTSFNGVNDAFVMKLNSSGSSLIYSTLLGGSGDDCVATQCAIALDETGAAYVTGTTASSNFPTTAGAFDTTFNGGADVFVTKINPGGDSLVYSTFLGGTVSDYGYGITVDGNGAAYVIGATWSTGFPTTPGAFKTTFAGGSSAFVTKLNATGSGLVYSTFLGDGSQGFSIAVDGSGVAFAAGQTFSATFPTTPDAYDTSYNGTGDAFVAKLSASGSALLYSTFLGGSGADCEISGDSRECFIAVDANGAVYVTGGTASTNFPTTSGAYDTSYNGGTYDVFVAKLAIGSATTYFISGRVTDDSGIGASGVTISSSSGSSSTTNASGYYTITNVITGTYTITPTKSGYTFAPITRTVSVPPNATGKDFKIRPSPVPFLDLPVWYSNFSQSAQGNVNGKGPGRVNSWFDHTSPNYGENADLTIWTGMRLTGATLTSKYTCNLGASCYDGHNGIDFQERVNDESILAAATGTVTNTVTSCSSGVFCGGGYGNQVWIDHHNGFATRYAHLKSVSVTNGTNITNIPAQPLGIMGNTGGTSIGGTGVHLHFGLYYDKNGDGQWTEDEVVDPYGWFGTGADSWSIPGGYLWKYPLNTQQSAGISGANITSPSGNVNTIVPSGALTTTVTLQLWDSPPVAAPSAQLRSSGGSFWLRVLEWLTGGGNRPTTRRVTASSFAQPATVSVTYGVTETQHLNVNQLTMYRWDETTSAWVALPTTVDTNLRQVTAQTTEVGSFDLQAPFLCPADTQEIDDNYYAAKSVSTNGSQASRLFDIAQDEDWFKFDAVGGTRYVIQTSNLASGVDTILQVYDLDGVTVLASDDNSGGGKASRLFWQAPQTGTYFIRVSQATGSAFGCAASYQVNVTQQGLNFFLPFIRKQ